jgi:hypothetical protein
MIIRIEAAIEQFRHARLNLRQKLAGDGDARAFDALKLGHEVHLWREERRRQAITLELSVLLTL